MTMRRVLAVVLLLGGGGGFLPPTGALAVEAAADQGDGRFRSPPGEPGPRGEYRDGPVYAVGDSVELRWETSFEAADLVLWQEQPDGAGARPAFATLAAGAKAKSLMWTVGYDGFPAHHDPGLSQVYYLELSRAGETRETEATAGGGGTRSRYFNITGTTTTTTTTRSGRRLPEAKARAKRATTTTTTMTAATNSSATGAPSPPPAPTVALIADDADAQPHPANSSSSSGGDGGVGGGGLSGGSLSGGAVAGIAVGAFVCGLALTGLAAWAVRRRRRGAGGRVAHTQGDIVMYAERQLREKGAVGWGSPPSPLRRKVRLPVEESREALALEVDAREAAERERWAARGAAAAVDRAMAAGCGSGGGSGGGGGGGGDGWAGAGSTRSGSSGWRSATMRSWV
ncbi:hypothetical protein LY76DRAFT_609465 [Colletotrichum caudatum]|nr:hypothetical protein LY76DRAFT_609465 [Colletotrichum caudatum]